MMDVATREIANKRFYEIAREKIAFSN